MSAVSETRAMLRSTNENLRSHGEIDDSVDPEELRTDFKTQILKVENIQLERPRVLWPRSSWTSSGKVVELGSKVRPVQRDETTGCTSSDERQSGGSTWSLRGSREPLVENGKVNQLKRKLLEVAEIKKAPGSTLRCSRCREPPPSVVAQVYHLEHGDHTYRMETRRCRFHPRRRETPTTENYKKITLLSMPGKVPERILHDRSRQQVPPKAVNSSAPFYRVFWFFFS